MNKVGERGLEVMKGMIGGIITTVTTDREVEDKNKRGTQGSLLISLKGKSVPSTDWVQKGEANPWSRRGSGPDGP